MSKAKIVQVVFETISERKAAIQKAADKMKAKTGHGSIRLFIEAAVDEKLERDAKP